MIHFIFGFLLGGTVGIIITACLMAGRGEP